MNNVVSIVGRPNVGKSSLYNKILGKRSSIVHDEAGITRDRLYATTFWSGKTFSIIDTGGIEIENKPFQEQIKIQVKIAIEESKVIIFVVDGRKEITKDDQLLINILRKSNKHIIIAANKLEGNKNMDMSIWSIGIGNVYKLSALHGDGVGDLLDEVIKYIDNDDFKKNNFKISIIGKPNVGKSSLLNKLSNSQRSIVSSLSGTTRDSIDIVINIQGKDFQFIDTAGINRKSKLIESVDHYALVRAKKSIQDSNLIILVLNYESQISHFHSVIGGYADKWKKPLVFVVNKWDLAQKKNILIMNKKKEIKNNFKFLSWAPILFISAKTGQRIDKLKSLIYKIHENTKIKIKTSLLNDVINDVQIMQPAQSFNGGCLRIKFINQIDKTQIPTFIFWVNNKKYLHFSYERFLENQIRDHFDFIGTPIKMIFKNSTGVKKWTIQK